MDKYVSKRYLKEKWKHLVNDMEIILSNPEDDRVSEEDLKRTRGNIMDNLEAIRWEIL